MRQSESTAYICPTPQTAARVLLVGEEGNLGGIRYEARSRGRSSPDTLAS